MRFSLSKLFLAIAMIGIACAGMIYRNRWWADGTFTLTLLLFTAAAIRAIALCGRDRAVATAFCTIGLGYLLMATTDALGPRRASLASNYALAELWKLTAAPDHVLMPDRRISWKKESAPFEAFLFATQDTPRPLESSIRESDASFFLIGHCLFSWLFALLAGWAAAATYSRRNRSTGPSST